MRPDFRRLLVTAVILLLAGVACVHDARAEGLDSLPNNFPHLNPSGFSATFSTQGFVDLTTEYSQPQGSNGRSCQTCHIPQQAWSINPNAIQLLFVLTGGTHPIFNPLDANNPDADLSTPVARWAGYSMMLTRGVFRAMPIVHPEIANAEDCFPVAVEQHRERLGIEQRCGKDLGIRQTCQVDRFIRSSRRAGV